MLLLYVLFGTFFLVLILSRFIKGEFKTRVAGRAGLSAMLVLTGIGHFLYPQGMTLMLPDFVPYKLALVYATGVIEFAAAIGLLVEKTQRITAWLLIIFFVLLLPCNIYAAIHHVDYQHATYEGYGTQYLWFRVPLQLFLIGWTFYFGVHADKPKNYSLNQ